MKKIDTLIVGFGLAGSILALQLRNRRKNFVVVTAIIPNASGVAAGMYNPIVFRRLLKTWMADELIPYANSFYLNAEKKLNNTFFHSLKYYKIIGKEEPEFWMNRSKHKETQPYLNPKIEYPNELKNIDMPNGVGQVNGAGWLNIPVFLNSFKILLQNEEKYIEDEIGFDELIFENDKVYFRNMEANRVVFCEGSYIKNNPWFNYLPFKPTKGEVITIKCDGLNKTSIINKNGFLLPLGNDYYKVGATYEWDNMSYETSISGREQLIEKLNQMIKHPYTIVKHEAGIRPSTNDRHPVLGAHRYNKNIFVFNGLGTKGVLLAPYFSNHLLEHVFDGKAIQKEVDIKRFNKYLIN